MGRYGIVLFVALFIDGMQALISLGLSAVIATATPVPVVGELAIPIGIGIAFALDICISIVFGSGLVLLLFYNGMCYWKYISGGGITELIPGLDILPAWTVATLLCVIRKMAEEGQLPGGAAAMFARFVAPATLVGMRFNDIKQQNRERVQNIKRTGSVSERGGRDTRASARQRLSANLREVDGIRAKTPPAPVTTRAPLPKIS